MKQSDDKNVIRSAQLASDISAKLKKGNLSGFQKDYEELWNLFDECKTQPNESLIEVAESLSATIRDLGEYRANRSDFIQLSGCVNDSRKLSNQFPNSIKITDDFTDLLVGLFSLKFQFQEFDYLEDYIPEVLALSRRFPGNRLLMARMSACLVNLLNLCPYGDIGLGKITPMLDRLGEINEQFPTDANICLAHLQALVTFCCAMKGHKRQDIYESYRAKLKKTYDDCLEFLQREEASKLCAAMRYYGLI